LENKSFALEINFCFPCFRDQGEVEKARLAEAQEDDQRPRFTVANSRKRPLEPNINGKQPIINEVVEKLPDVVMRDVDSDEDGDLEEYDGEGGPQRKSTSKINCLHFCRNH